MKKNQFHIYQNSFYFRFGNRTAVIFRQCQWTFFLHFISCSNSIGINSRPQLQNNSNDSISNFSLSIFGSERKPRRQKRSLGGQLHPRLHHAHVEFRQRTSTNLYTKATRVSRWRRWSHFSPCSSHQTRSQSFSLYWWKIKRDWEFPGRCCKTRRHFYALCRRSFTHKLLNTSTWSSTTLGISGMHLWLAVEEWIASGTAAWNQRNHWTKRRSMWNSRMS